MEFRTHKCLPYDIQVSLFEIVKRTNLHVEQERIYQDSDVGDAYPPLEKKHFPRETPKQEKTSFFEKTFFAAFSDLTT